MKRIPGESDTRLEILVAWIVRKVELVHARTIAGRNTGSGIGDDGRHVGDEAARFGGNCFDLVTKAQVESETGTELPAGLNRSCTHRGAVVMGLIRGYVWATAG